MIKSTFCQILLRLPCLTKPRLCFINKLMHLQTQKIHYLSCAWCSDVILRANVFIRSLLVIGVPDIIIYSPFFPSLNDQQFDTERQRSAGSKVVSNSLKAISNVTTHFSRLNPMNKFRQNRGAVETTEVPQINIDSQQ